MRWDGEDPHASGEVGEPGTGGDTSAEPQTIIQHPDTYQTYIVPPRQSAAQQSLASTGDPVGDAAETLPPTFAPSALGGAAPQPTHHPDEWITQDLPADYQQRPLPPNVATLGMRRGGLTRRPWIVVLSVLLVVAVIGTALAAVHNLPGRQSTNGINGCASGSACDVGNAYLLDYSAGKYEAMYALTSKASQTRFSDPKILRGNYKDAHSYIVNRTSAILDEAAVASISVTAGTITESANGTATLPARIVMTSARIGAITQDITLPLVKEGSAWRVEWSPGLIFSKLDDATYDPNYHRVVRLYGESGIRGTIYDRDNHILAKDDTVYTIGVVPGQISNESALLATLSAKLDLTSDQIKGAYAGAAKDSYVPLRTITPQLFAQIGAALGAVTGVKVTQHAGRVYPYGADTAAVTGYVQSVSADDLKNDTSHYYSQGDVLGRAGVEAWGEEYLRPTKGGKLQIVDLNADGSDGPVFYSIAERAGGNGADIHTAISLPDQQAAMNQMRQFPQNGSGAMAVDPVTGEVLTLASFPIYDPNNFSLGYTPNALAAFNALDHPYLNRAVSSAYPVGSVFKLVTLSAGLEHGVKSTDVFTCNGSYQVPGEDHVRIDDLPSGHGALKPGDAVPPSCDVVFWQIAVLLNSKDPTTLPTVAKAFGFGEKPSIFGISDDVINPGLVPDPQYLKTQKNATWTAIDAANLAIGQGFFQTSPAQVALMTAALANGGKRMQARLVTSVLDPTGKPLPGVGTTAPTQIGTLPLSPDNLSIVQVAMNASTSQPNGTSYRELKDFPVHVAGKTGTAESGQANPHSWFTAYAPFSPLSGPAVPPRIAAGVIVEYSSYGEFFALPVVIQILKAQFGV